jgi:putative aldouronate transport system permease protein
MIKRKGIPVAETIRVVFMTVFMLVVLYPFVYALAYSLSNSNAVMLKDVTFYPIKFTFFNYKKIFEGSDIYFAFLVSIYRAVIGASAHVIVTALAAYAVSKRDLPGYKFFNLYFIIPMYISGGLIPTYINIHNLGLFNNLLVYILPYMFYAFNMLLIRTYFDTIPDSLEESAKIDGANYFTIFLKIMLPLSMPVIAIILMFSGIWQWNAWFDVVLYVTNKNLFPLQKLLQNMLMDASSAATAMVQSTAANTKRVSSESLRMAMVIIASTPIIIVYPFFQKHFVTGIMIGSVKG